MLILPSRNLLAIGGAPEVGDFWDEQGGYIGARNYNRGDAIGTIVVAPASTQSGQLWTPGGGSYQGYSGRANGLTATNALGTNSSSYPALAYAYNLVINGQTDWYLWAANEGLAVAANRASFVGGESFGSGAFWTATENSGDGIRASFIDMSGGTEITIGYKGNTLQVRPIRFVPN